MLDFVYEAQRNNLIPEAERYADRIAGRPPALKGASREVVSLYEEYARIWNIAFHGKMDQLVKERLRRKT